MERLFSFVVTFHEKKDIDSMSLLYMLKELNKIQLYAEIIIKKRLSLKKSNKENERGSNSKVLSRNSNMTLNLNFDFSKSKGG